MNSPRQPFQLQRHGSAEAGRGLAAPAANPFAVSHIFVVDSGSNAALLCGAATLVQLGRASRHSEVPGAESIRSEMTVEIHSLISHARPRASSKGGAPDSSAFPALSGGTIYLASCDDHNSGCSWLQQHHGSVAAQHGRAASERHVWRAEDVGTCEAAP
jgi:hypothetical protein